MNSDAEKIVTQLAKNSDNLECLLCNINDHTLLCVFSITRRDGLLAQAKILQSIDTTRSIINYDMAFIIACNAGHLDIIELLKERSNIRNK